MFYKFYSTNYKLVYFASFGQPCQPIVVRLAQQSWQVRSCPGLDFQKTLWT